MNRLLVTAFAAFALFGCAKVVVVPVPANQPTPANGVIYALPNTVVRISLKIDSTGYQIAKYASYAEIFAPSSKPICKDPACTEEKKTKFSLQQGATFATYGEPDPNNVFLVKFTNGGAIDQQISMTWDEAGILTAATSQVTNRTTDVAMSGLKLLAGLGTKAAAGAAAADLKTLTTCPNTPKAVYDSDAQLVTVDAWAIPILTSSGNVDSTTGSTLLTNYCAIEADARKKLPQDKALLTAATQAYDVNVSSLASARFRLLTGGSVTSDASAILTQVTTELTNQLTKLYLGSKSTTTWDGTLDVRPTSFSNAIIFLHLDPAQGFCVDGADIPPNAKPVPDKFTIVGAACASAPAVALGFAYYPDTSKQLFTKITDITEGDRSFRYRIPGQVSAAITDVKGKNYGTGVMWVAQFGKVISLPADRRSKMLSYDLTFVEATGGLKTFKLGTTGGLDAATIDALTSVGGTVLDYRAAASKRSDELSTLTNEDQMLKLRDDICTIQKKYGVACTVEPQPSEPQQ
jgi:hypothetical protein